MSKHVVLSGLNRRGLLIEESDAPRYESLGGCSLPVEPELLLRHGAAGFVERHWDGVKLSDPISSVVCLMSIYAIAHPRNPRIYWAACVESDEKPIGSLRLATVHAVTMNAGSVMEDPRNVADFKNARPGDCDGQYIVSGSAPLLLAGDGLVSLALLGSGRNARVLWTALTQAR